MPARGEQVYIGRARPPPGIGRNPPSLMRGGALAVTDGQDTYHFPRIVTAKPGQSPFAPEASTPLVLRHNDTEKVDAVLARMHLKTGRSRRGEPDGVKIA